MEFFQHAALLAAGAMVLVQEALKFVPGSFAARYPVVTNILLSIATAAILVWQELVTKPVAWSDWLLLVGTISVVASIVYTQVVKQREVLKTPVKPVTP